MGLKSHLENRLRGWYPKEANLPANTFPANNKTAFAFTRRFWISLAVSYLLFALLIVLPYLLGYIDSTILGYGLAGIADSLVLMMIVGLLNRADPLFRKRLGYVAVGVWLGFAVFVLFALVLFPHQFLAAGSWAIILLITIAPTTGGIVGYVTGKRKYSNI